MMRIPQALDGVHAEESYSSKNPAGLPGIACIILLKQRNMVCLLYRRRVVLWFSDGILKPYGEKGEL